MIKMLCGVCLVWFFAVSCRKPAKRIPEGFVSGSSVYVRDNPGILNTKRLFYLNYFDDVKILEQKKADDGQVWYKILVLQNQREGWILGKFVKTYAHPISDRDLFQFFMRLRHKEKNRPFPLFINQKIYHMAGIPFPGSGPRKKAVSVIKSIDYQINLQTVTLFLRGKTESAEGEKKMVNRKKFYKNSRHFLYQFDYQPAEKTFVKTDMLAELVQKVIPEEADAKKSPFYFGDLQTLHVGKTVMFFIDICFSVQTGNSIRRIFFVMLPSRALKKCGDIMLYEENKPQGRVTTSTVIYRQMDTVNRRIWVNYTEMYGKTGQKNYYRTAYFIEDSTLVIEYVRLLN